MYNSRNNSRNSSYDNPHHISSANEMYNNLVDFIIDGFLIAFPHENPDWYTAEDMVSKLASTAKEGIALRDRLTTEANRNINEDFATMRSLMASLEKNTYE